MSNHILKIFNGHRKEILIAAIFFLALFFRFELSMFNRQANDNHLEVISWIIDKQTLPSKEDCWECSQPKIYYILNARLMKFFEVTSLEKRMVFAQMINFFFSAVLLLFIWLFIRNQSFSFRIKILAFSLLAFNPCLAGINAQVTNDTLEILAGTMAIYFADLFFRKWKPIHFVFMTLSIILACVTKGSGLSLLLGILIICATTFLIQAKQKRRFLLFNFLFFIIAIALTVPFVGGYYSNYKKYDNAFINNIPKKDPPPEFFHETYVNRPGITSVVNGYFTFRIFNMLRQPYINNDFTNYPLHRTSLWSQLYGRTFFVHFDQHPGTWATTEVKVVWVGRALLFLGLAPLTLFLIGCYLSCRDMLRFIIKKNKSGMFESISWIHFVLIVACLFFIVKYTYDYRDFATMKSIFVFPVLASVIYLFMRGFEKIKSEFVSKIFSAAIIALVFLSIADINLLINQLKNWVKLFPFE
jgi:hypothetical protein